MKKRLAFDVPVFWVVAFWIWVRVVAAPAAGQAIPNPWTVRNTQTILITSGTELSTTLSPAGEIFIAGADNFPWVVRSCQYLNNIVEQDHRRIKRASTTSVGY